MLLTVCVSDDVGSGEFASVLDVSDGVCLLVLWTFCLSGSKETVLLRLSLDMKQGLLGRERVLLVRDSQQQYYL